MTDNALGEFLQASRGRLRPGDVGLPAVGRRRVPGLRREEVAVLAGMNTDYYARLEQGRESSPSQQILDALASALQMDPEAREHLYRLTGAAPKRGRVRPVATVEPSLEQLLEGYTSTPAFVMDPAMDLLAVNDIGRALFSPFEDASNLAFMTFLDPAARDFFRLWDLAAENVVANLRQAEGVDPDYARLRDVIDTLIETNVDFARLWRTQEIRGKTSDRKELVHPEVGPLSLRYHTFDVRGARGQQLVVYHAQQGSPSAHGLMLLGSLHARARE